MTIRKMYYDNFTNEYVKEMDQFAPPERYLSTYRGNEIYIETFEDYQGQRLDIAYDDFDVKHHLVSRTRFAVSEKYGFMLMSARMIKRTIPAELFDKYAERFGIDWSEEG